VVLGIKLPDDQLYDKCEAVMSVPGLGRLLVFDPTMPHTPPADAFYLQRNNGLLVAGEHSRLLQFPGSSPERTELIRRGQFVLSTDGGLRGNVSETLSGFQAEVTRLRLGDANERERRKEIEDFLAASVGSFNLEKYEYLNLNEPEKDVELSYSFRANIYLSRSGEVFAFRPNILALVEDYEILKQKGERKNPILMSGLGTSLDEFEIILPAGYTVDVLPAPVELSNGFADYQCFMQLNGGILFLKRQFKIKQDYLPPERFQEVWEMFRFALQ